MDTIMQTLDALVENIVPPTATAKMPPAEEKKSMKSVEIIADENNFLLIRFGDNIFEPKKDGWGAYLNPEHIISLLFGNQLESAIIDMFLLLLRRKKEDQPSEYYEYDCLPAYGKVKILKQGFLEIFGLDTSAWPIVVPTPCPQ
ncbi:hypothetical protein Taro_004956 [Colocasia esculenta]|uniref:Uncharacterized protein n=1 Tax=Colocasia esculenta TaxID=4460 RepID=A0A843TR14_COLES|nr:hypothetical protein [Colocasia esculenta]